MMSYLREVDVLKCQFEKVEISQISRVNNNHVDSLVTLAFSMADPLLRIVLVELLPFFSVSLPNKALVLSIHPSTSWMEPFVTYL